MHDIVGAGSAGCAITARASEDPQRTVLLVEAGPDYSDVASTPDDLVNSHNNSYRAHDWGLSYQSTRERSVAFSRGRVTGGSSAVNTTIALRGMPEDYDKWASQGNPEWSWSRVLPAFNRLERDLDFGECSYHGDAGPISIRRYRPNELTPQQAAFIDAARELGYPDCPDANEPWGWGSGPHPMNKLGRLRISCAIGYLAPARARPNLRIRATTLVLRLLVEGSRCTGVGSSLRNDLQIEMLSFFGRRGEGAFGIAAVLEYQHGRGELRLASADPDAAPIIDNRFCEDERDLARLAQCYKDALAFTHTQAITGMIERIAFPHAASMTSKRNAATLGLTDDDIAALCRKFAGSGYHPCGTAKMGPAQDALAVVNQYGQCHSVDQLVVADASIMPGVPRANTNLTCIMIGEKVGEWLRTRPALYGL